ncbi:alanyl-tRNA editing protein [Halorarius litoreus]|uniref:alanyl-tRNA editing protein n=1 Tax=Halorarius litoreus TaxID=2962676 RepID=UPI0020CBE90C|nr:alanyl-tRNA editing protein [Halorarius litoreus]
MTEPLYLDADPPQTFTATVVRSLDDRVVLDRTGFYPEGGGQPADHGTLATDDCEWAVTDVQKRDTIYHHVADPPAEGTTVTGTVDWNRRRAHSRYHTAQHLLSAVLLDEYDAPTSGNQLYADRARIDVTHDRFDDATLAAIETRLNDLVDAGLDVSWYTMDRERAAAELDPERTRLDLLPDSITELRLVEIADGDGGILDRTACAGTHVASTADIGMVSIEGRETAGKGRERIRFTLAEP